MDDAQKGVLLNVSLRSTMAFPSPLQWITMQALKGLEVSRRRRDKYAEPIYSSREELKGEADLGKGGVNKMAISQQILTEAVESGRACRVNGPVECMNVGKTGLGTCRCLRTTRIYFLLLPDLLRQGARCPGDEHFRGVRDPQWVTRYM